MNTTIQDFIDQGKIELVDTKPNTGIYVYHIYALGFDKGCYPIHADDEKVVIAQAWPGNGYLNAERNCFFVHRNYKSHVDTIRLDFMPICESGVNSLVNVAEFFSKKRDNYDNIRFNPDTSITKYLKFRDEESYLEYCQSERSDYYCDYSTFMTKAQYELEMRKQEEAEKALHLKKMNAWVKQFSNERGLSSMSVEFIQALRDHLDGKMDEWQSRIDGAKEDGLCIGMGASVESWYDHMDGLRIGHDRCADFADDVWDWCHEELPMLMAKWKEQQAITV